MSLSQKPTLLIVSSQMSVRADPWTGSTHPDAIMWEDGCTVPRPRLRLSDPSLWCVGGVIAAATAWIMT